MPSELTDIGLLLRRVALRLRACPTPDAVLDMDPKNRAFSNVEIAETCERVAQGLDDEQLLALKTVCHGGRLTPEQMVDTAKSLALVPFNGAISVNPAFLVGLAEVADLALRQARRTAA